MRQLRLEGKLIAHNVGQGLFYSGKLNISDFPEAFNFIYDCGSEKRLHLKKIINSYKRDILRNSTIDLLIISHLHDDHIIGLEDLLVNTNLNTAICKFSINRGKFL